MKTGDLLNNLSGFSGNRVIITRNQGVSDIIGAMMEAHKLYAGEYDKISGEFWAGSDEKTARKIYDFLKREITYHAESDRDQRIMSPAAILTLKKNDCKNYALFVAGVLDSLKRQRKVKGEILYRFASYQLLDTIPHHVFIVLQTGGREIWIDPVLNSFDNRKPYFHKIDRNTMALYSVNGIGQTRKQARQERRAERRKPAPSGTASAEQPQRKRKNILLQIPLAPARTAFLLLVGLNFAGTATKLQAAFARAADKTANWWAKLGGNPNKLLRQVERGAKKRRILGAGIGEPVTTAATAAAAAPILVKLAQFLRDLGIDPEELGRAGKEIIANKVRSAVDRELQRDGQQARRDDEQLNEIVNQSGTTSEPGQRSGIPWGVIALAGGLVLLAAKK